MRERQIGQFVQSLPEINRSQLRAVADSVSLGLGFGPLDELGKGRERTIAVTIANSLINNCTFLGIPIPEVGLANGSILDHSGEKEVGEYLATITIIDGMPVIGFSETYIEALVHPFSMYTPYLVLVLNAKPIVEITAHECYHLWQGRHFPKRKAVDSGQMQEVGKDAAVAKSNGDLWLEKGARRYGLMYRREAIRRKLTSTFRN
jgi:hypothetical protein